MTSIFVTNPYDFVIQPEYLKIINSLRGQKWIRERFGLVEVEYQIQGNECIDTSQIAYTYLEFNIDRTDLDVDEISGLKEILLSFLKEFEIDNIQVQILEDMTSFIPYNSEGLVYVNPDNNIVIDLNNYVGRTMLSDEELAQYALSDFDMVDNLVNIQIDKFGLTISISTDTYAIDRFRDRVNKLKTGYFVIPSSNLDVIALYHEIANMFGGSVNENVVRSNIDFDIPAKLWYSNAVDSIMKSELPKYRIVRFEADNSQNVQIILIYLATKAYLNLIEEEPTLRDFYYSVKVYPDLTLEAMFANYDQIQKYKTFLSGYVIQVTNDLIQRHTIIPVRNVEESIAVRLDLAKYEPITVVLTDVESSYFVVIPARITYPFITTNQEETVINKLNETTTYFTTINRDENSFPPEFSSVGRQKYIDNLVAKINLKDLAKLDGQMRNGVILGYFKFGNIPGMIEYPKLPIDVKSGELKFGEFSNSENVNSNLKNSIDTEVVLFSDDLVYSPSYPDGCSDMGIIKYLGEITTSSNDAKSLGEADDLRHQLQEKWSQGDLLTPWGKSLYAKTNKLSYYFPSTLLMSN